ncbi:MAG TPA: peptidylprolyl isomerase, partial [Candidatus Binataceae bacterium]|nr:peptidylprolyl isomerase [Candidatus Binataceae bacterium]
MRIMLGAFRKHAYSWGTRALLGFMIIVFVIFFGGLGSYFLQVKPVAAVDCYTYFGIFTAPGCRNILPDEIDREAANIRRAVQNSRGPDAAQILQGVNLRQLAVEFLVEQTLIERQAHKLGLTVTDDDLAKAIASQTVFQVDGHFDQQRYYSILHDTQLEPTDFENETRGKILADTLQHLVTAGVAISPEEARAEYSRLGEKIAVAYIEFPSTNFTPPPPTDPEVAKFYADNKESFREPERVKIAFIRYDFAALEPREPPADDEIKTYYEENLKTLFSHPDQVHVRHILIPVAEDASAADKATARKHAEDLLDRVKSGASFTDLAKQYSGDPGSSQNGGDLGNVSRGELVKPFEEVAFKLKPGEVGFAETQFGFHVIQVIDARGAKIDDIQEARPKIVAALKLKQGMAIARQDMEADEAAANLGHELSELAAKRGLAAVTTPYFAQEDKIKGAEDDANLKKEVFDMQGGEIRSIRKAQAPYLVKMLDRKPARLPPLAEIKDRVIATMLRMSAEAQARQAAAALLKQIKSPAAFDAIVTNNHLQVKTTSDFVRAD